MDETTEQDAEMIRVGATIRALREAHGLSRAELGRAIGKSLQLIERIENGKRRATPEVCRGIADTMRIPLAAITVRNYEDIRDREPAA